MVNFQELLAFFHSISLLTLRRDILSGDINYRFKKIFPLLPVMSAYFQQGFFPSLCFGPDLHFVGFPYMFAHPQLPLRASIKRKVQKKSDLNLCAYGQAC